MLILKLTLILQLTVKTALISHSKNIFVCGAAHLYSFAAVSRMVTEAIGDGLAFEMKAEVVTGARRSFRDHRPDGETERVILFSPPHARSRSLSRSQTMGGSHGRSQSDIMGSISNAFQQFQQQASLHTQHRCQLVKYCWSTERSGSSYYISGP